MLTKKEAALKRKLFIEQYMSNHYNVARTCRSIGISRQTYYNWLKEDPKFKEQIDAFVEEDLDNAEETLRIMRQGIPKRDENNRIIGWVLEPNPAAVIFTLKTKGKHRGWNEEGQIPTEDGKLKIELVSNESDKEFSKKLLESKGGGDKSRRDEKR